MAYNTDTPEPFKPADLAGRIVAFLNGTLHTGGATYSAVTTKHGRDNWEVRCFVNVTLSDGTSHRMIVDVEDTPPKSPPRMIEASLPEPAPRELRSPGGRW